MLKPKRLNTGDVIGFFSPSSPATVFAPKRFERAKKFIESKGFELIAGKLTGKEDFYRSGSILERAEELNELIRDPKVRCIISTIGGMNSNSLLPYIDYEALKKDPKIIIGYSDVTALLLGIYSKTGLITFYGPALVASFGDMGVLVEETFDYFSDILVKPKPIPFIIKNPKLWTDEFISWEEQEQQKKTNANELVVLNEGKATGRLIVGNLNTISGIYGTEFMPKIKQGDILVIEDALKNATDVERSFAHLKIAGIFDLIGGLVLGKHEKFDSKGSNRKPYEILMEVISKARFPILAEYDCCHTHPMITLPIGIRAELNTDTKELTLLENWMDL
jgi:muramoyltetrapeptide carboxypeptidase